MRPEALVNVYLQAFAALRTHAGSIVVPDGAAARALELTLDQAATSGGRAWRPPTVLAWPTALGQRFDDERLAAAPAVAALDFVLSPEQELAVWQQVVADDDAGAAPPAAALLAREAWRLVYAWALPWPPASAGSADHDYGEDVTAFLRWGAAYRERTAVLRVTDQARLLARATRPLAPTMLAHGFIAPPPSLARLLATAATAPAATADPAFAPRAYADREQELYAAFSWAQTQAQPGARVVVALDSLRQDQDLVRRCVRDLWGSEEAVNLAPRTMLADDPRVRTALAVLELKPVLPWTQVSAILLSPSIAGAASERSARAHCDRRLRALGRYELPLSVVLDYLGRPAHASPQLAALLAASGALQAAVPRRQPLVRWLAHFAQTLALAGWPGDGPLDAETLRLQSDWGEVCDRLQRLDAVLPAQTSAAALARLRRLLAETPLRAVTGVSGIFVVPPAVACVLAPTHLWLAGCESAALVSGARPSPCLPLALQRAAGVPGADAAQDLARARLLVAALARGTDQAVASYRAGDGEQVFSPSPLIAGLRGTPVAAVTRWLPSAWRLPLATFEELDDSQAPPLAAAQSLRGGVAVLTAQAACPFRALARFRLTASAVDEPRPGLAAVERGNAVHRALAAVWDALGNQAALLALTSSARAELVAQAARQAVPPRGGTTPLERALDAVERERLVALVDVWLTFECTRPAFTVTATEQAATVRLGALDLRIRVDRIDRLDDGSAVIVDYKTGRCSVSDWLPPRLNEPQLPIYACTDVAPDTRAVAFAQVDRARPRWLTSGDNADPLSWAARRAEWQADLELVAGEFAGGRAAVAPKRGLTTCRLCEQALLCRINDSRQANGQADNEADAETDNEADGEPADGV